MKRVLILWQNFWDFFCYFSCYQGYTDEGDRVLSDLKFETTVVYDNTCTEMNEDQSYADDTMLCANGGGKNSSCIGEGGGTILIKGNTDTSNVQVQVGC